MPLNADGVIVHPGADEMATTTEEPALRVSRTLPEMHGTKFALMQYLLHGGATVEALADSAGIHPSVARRHMTDLVGAGFVIAAPARGTRGRPRVTYSLTTGGRELFFARYDVVLDCLTRSSLRRSGVRPTRALYAEAAATLARDLGFPASVDSVVRALREVGFQPELRKGRGDQLVVSHNCPVFRQARKNPDLLCKAFHTRLITGAHPGWKAELRQTMATGATECIHLLAAP